jgi:hypothetical protein
MPLSRISLRKGRTPDYLQALSDSLHRALVEAFDVPRDERWFSDGVATVPRPEQRP